LTQKSGAVSRVLWLTLVANLAVASCKLVFGFMTGLASVIADGYHSLLDASSNLVGLAGIRISAAPPDEDHPYGHQKFEIFSSMGIALLLFVAAFNIVNEAMDRWNSREEVESLTLGYILLILTLLLTYLLQRWQRKKAQELSSVILHADSEHTRSDFLATVGALVAVISVDLGYPEVDSIVALCIGLAIARSGVLIALQSAGILADKAPLPAEEIILRAQEFPEVLLVRDVRSRGFGSGIFVDLSLQLDPGLTLDAAHEIAHRVEDRLREEIPEIHDVVIHVEPFTGGE
jgi:cation diffusion facilitator family transporter